MKSKHILQIYSDNNKFLSSEQTLQFICDLFNINKKEFENEGEEFEDQYLLIRLIDRNDDGKISKKELDLFIGKLKKYNYDLEDEDLFELAFDLIDIDSNGTLDNSEMKIFMDKFLKRKASEDELNKIIDIMDRNNDGIISRDEFLNVLSPNTQMMKDFFEKQDKEKRGYLTSYQCLNCLNEMGIEIKGKTKSIMLMIFNIVDENMDNKIDVYDYIRFVRLVNRCGQQQSFEKMYEFIFDEIDQLKKGYLTFDELKEFIIQQKSFDDEQDFYDLMKMIDKDRNKQINKVEFVGMLETLFTFH